MKDRITGCLIFLFSLLLALGISEIVIRSFKLAPEVVYIEKWRMRLASNPAIGYEPIPHLDSREKSIQFYGYQGLSNDLGFRDESHRALKPDGQKRILVLGDSIVAGLWIERDEDVYPALLEKKFQDAGKNIEVLNFGVSGYNTQQEVETLKEKGLEYQPDIVILTYCLNDAYVDDGGIYYHLKEAEKNESAINVASLSPLLRQSALYRFVTYRVLAAEAKSPQSEMTLPDFLTSDKTAAYFEALAQLQADHDFEVYIVLFPDFDFIDRRAVTYQFFEDHKRIRDLARRYEFEFVDLYEPMKECKLESGELLLSYDRFHPRPEGNECAAQAVYDEIMRTSHAL